MRATDVMTTNVITVDPNTREMVTAGAFAEHGDGGPKVRCASSAHTQPRGPQPLKLTCRAVVADGHERRN